ncbi:hypothetical protein BVG19_g1018 [[Candida] boidinii]|nr:hypothetical protein BVG19_g1018 [[Candida] boidinii]OWB50627.1 hypothetical protein B5S27_g2179 [[Candida] boidinii]
MNDREPLVIADTDDTPDNWSYSISSSMESLLVEDTNGNGNGNGNGSNAQASDYDKAGHDDKRFDALRNGGLSIIVDSDKSKISDRDSQDLNDSQLINRSKSKSKKKKINGEVNGDDSKDYAPSSIDILSNDSEQISSNFKNDDDDEDDDEQMEDKINNKGSIPISRMKSGASTNNVANSLSSSISNSSMSFISKASLANPETTKSEVMSYSTTANARGNHPNGIPEDGIGFLPAQMTGSASVSESSTSLLPGLATSSIPSIEINRNSTKETLEAISKSHENDYKNNGANGDSSNSPYAMTPTNSILSKISTSVASFTNRASSAAANGPPSSSLSQIASRSHQRTVSADNATLNNSQSHIIGSRRHSISNINKEISIPEEETVVGATSGTPTTGPGQLETTIGVSGTPDMMSYRRSRSRRTTRSSSSAAAANSPMVDGQDSPKTPIFASGSAFINNQQPQPQPQLTPITPTTPKMITPKITTSEPSFDRNLYTEEKYLDTQYRYAASKRNADFHTLFPNIPTDDRLLDDFSCALSREFLIQGRLYVSEHYLGFNSNFLGWVTNVVISHDDISNFEKKVTAGFFPNGIVVETKDSKYNFASFMSRDTTFNFLETIWSKSVALSKSRNENSRDVDLLVARVVSHDSLVDNGNSNNNLLSEEDVFTIDEDSPEDYTGRGGLNTPLNGSSFSLNENFTKKNSNLRKNVTSERQKKKKQRTKINHDDELKIINNPNDENFKFEYKGPNHNSNPTEIKYDLKKEKANLLFDEEFDVPIGLLFNIIFGKNTDFHKKLMAENECFDFSEYGEFNIKKGDEDDGDDDSDFISKRKFKYQRNLGFAIGPASTNVECEEIIKSLDYKDSIEVLSITRTPNVPSGGVFTVQTRYNFAWAGSDKSRLQLSYKVVWTGSSWIKSMVESSTSGGQNKVASDLKKNLNDLIDSNIDFIKKKIKEYDESEAETGEIEVEEIEAEDTANVLTATSSGNFDQETLKDEEKPVVQAPNKVFATSTIETIDIKSEGKRIVSNSDWISNVTIMNILIVIIILIQIVILREIFIIKSANSTDFQLFKLIKNFKFNDDGGNEYNDEDLIKLIKLLKRSIE